MSEFITPDNPYGLKIAALDLDDFLVCSSSSIVECHRSLYRKRYKQAPDATFTATANRLIGEPAPTVFWELYPEHLAQNPEDLDGMIDEFRGIVSEDPAPTQPIEGVAEEIERLREAGLLLTIVSRRGGVTMAAALESGGVDPNLFEKIYTAEHFTGKDDALRSIMREQNVSNAQLCMAGDSVGDAADGKKVKAWTFGVPRPGLSPEQHEEHRQKLEQAGAYVFDSFVELGRTALRPIIN